MKRPNVHIDEKSRKPITLNADAHGPLSLSAAKKLRDTLTEAIEWVAAGPEHRRMNPGQYSCGWADKVCK